MSEPNKTTEMTRGQKKIEELRNMYSETKTRNKAKILFYGDWGTGKSTLSATMPGPIFMQTFDPGGEKIAQIQDGFESGDIIVDTRWQSRNFKSSEDQFKDWNDEYSKMKREGFFDEIGTYVIDSFTTFQRLIIDASIGSNTKNKIVSSKMPVKIPQMRDYNVQGAAIEHMLADILDLPCHVMIIAHAEENEDDTTGIIDYQPLIVGKKLRKQIPLLFDEIYVVSVRGKKYELHLNPKGMYKARSRLTSLNPKIQDSYDVTDIGSFSFSKDILKPAGYCKDEEVLTISTNRD